MSAAVFARASLSRLAAASFALCSSFASFSASSFVAATIETACLASLARATTSSMASEGSADLSRRSSYERHHFLRARFVAVVAAPSLAPPVGKSAAGTGRYLMPTTAAATVTAPTAEEARHPLFLDVEAGAAAAAPAGFSVVDDAGADCGAVDSSNGEDDQSYVDCAQLSNSF